MFSHNSLNCLTAKSALVFIGGFFIVLIFSKLHVGRKNTLKFVCYIVRYPYICRS